MSETWNGIGTKYYGSKDQYPDSTFVTTEWVVILYIPIIPIQSFRVAYAGTSHGWRKTTTQYIIIKKLSLDWQQVFSIYFLTFVTLIVAFFMGWFAGSIFAAKDWYIVSAMVGFFIPIFISGKLFFAAKPSTKSPAPVLSKAKVDISKVSKPNITPPLILSDPDIKPLEPLIDKYEPILNKTMNGPFGKLPEWTSIRKALNDVIFLNFQTISYYMDNEVYGNNSEKKNSLEQQVKTVTTLASSCAWMVGKEWGEKDPNLKGKLHNKEAIGINDVPFDAMQLLANAVYFPYFLFAVIFTEYYDSTYGQNVRHQKNGHLVDTYQSMMKGMLACFLMGVKS